MEYENLLPYLGEYFIPFYFDLDYCWTSLHNDRSYSTPQFRYYKQPSASTSATWLEANSSDASATGLTSSSSNAGATWLAASSSDASATWIAAVMPVLRYKQQWCRCYLTSSKQQWCQCYVTSRKQQWCMCYVTSSSDTSATWQAASSVHSLTEWCHPPSRATPLSLYTYVYTVPHLFN